MRYGYDDAGRQTTITNPLGELTQLTFDGRGLRISAKDKAGHVTTFQRDAMGRVTQATLADGSIDTITYDARGNVASRIDAAGKTTLFAHDSLRRLVSVTDALGHTTGYVYDEVGNRTSITDANGHITPFQYDQRGRRISRTLPGGQSETLAYDAAGEVTSHTDFNGKTMTYQYDFAGRLLSKTPDPSFNSPAVRYTYTGLGRRASMTDVSGTTTYGYDLLGRLTSKQSPEGNITYAYDPAGNLISLQAGALTVSYAYDSLNRLALVTEPSTGTTAYSYDPAGNLQNRTYPNGIVHAYSYDSLNRLTTVAVNKDSSPEASYAQTLGPTGRLLSVSELGGRTVNYTYDADYRLVGESVALAMSGLNGSVGYAYDAVGNRTQTISTLAGVSSVSFGYDVDDRLSEDTYDAAGNTVSSGGLGNFYDFENRLLQRGSVSIVYDGDGNRVSETAGGVTTKYLIDDQNPTGFPQVIAETGSDGGTRTFVYGLERISQLQFTPSSKSSVTSFYIYDGHGSVRALANPAGAITDTYDYDAFGNLINRTGTTVNNYMFAGEPFDPALGIYYNRARYYDERRGRFWTLDTLEGNPGDPQSLHKYLYTRADPVNRRDPSGHEDIEEEVVATEISVELDTMAVAEPFAATVLEANTVVEVSAFGDTIVEAATIVEAEGVPAAVEALGAETAGAAAESLVPQAVQAAAELSTEQLAAITAENQVVYNALINLVDYPLTAAEEALLEQEIEITLELAIEREIAADTALARLISHLTSKGFW
jgi:RHS repeat-associated protein